VSPDEPFLLKNLFDRSSVGAIRDAVASAFPEFDCITFMERVFDESWPDLELKQRIRHISKVLHATLPGTYRDQLTMLLAAVPSAAEDFSSLVFSDFVEAFGTDDWDASVPALATFTKLASAEFAIRPFIASDQERTLARMLAWTAEPHPAVRRLATEGCRPRLPWGMRLQALVADPAPILPILERLHADPDESVRRSVSNNLNDISKDHPQVVINLLRAWSPQPGSDTYRLARHALRTLLKRGDPDALEVLGFKAGLSVKLDILTLEPGVPQIGGSTRLAFTITSTLAETQPVMVDYAVHYVKADGSTSPKVFRLGSVVMDPGVPITYGRKLSFRQMTTRTHRPGLHRIEVLANGAVAGAISFELIAES
jgi:3-methyladenine DNA glycosylase AlkC